MKTAEFLTTCFGVGKLPIAPGTFGSLPPVILYLLSAYYCPYPYSGSILMTFFVLAASGICIQYAPAMMEASGKEDPQMVVADEVAGQAVVMLFIALLDPMNSWLAGALGFILFRLFDIVKPWPCRKLEKLPRGIGILADDLMAGIYACIIFAAAYHWMPTYFA